MSISPIGSYCSVPVINKGKTCNIEHLLDSDATTFKRHLVEQEKSALPSFIGNVYTKEELMQSMDEKIQGNQDKKKSLEDMIKDSCIEGDKALFRFVGETKIYTFEEYIEEIQRRSK